MIMTRRLKIGILSFVVFCFITAGNAFAKLEPDLGLFMTITGSTVQQENHVFGWNETPYSFLQFDSDDLNPGKPLRVRWKWKYKDIPNIFFTWERDTYTNFSIDPLNLWFSPDVWDSKKMAGDWTVQVNWINPGGGGGGMMKTDFTIVKNISTEDITVVPEPVSSTLFVIGGAALGFRRFFKKKKI